MTIDVFWQRVESAIYDYGECADGLMMLHKKLQNEERQMDIGLTAAKEKVRTEFP